MPRDAFRLALLLLALLVLLALLAPVRHRGRPRLRVSFPLCRSSRDLRPVAIHAAASCATQASQGGDMDDRDGARVSKAKKRGDAAVRSAFAFVLTMGLVNLFADTTYEGAGSINGPFLGGL